MSNFFDDIDYLLRGKSTPVWRTHREAIAGILLLAEMVDRGYMDLVDEDLILPLDCTSRQIERIGPAIAVLIAPTLKRMAREDPAIDTVWDDVEHHHLTGTHDVPQSMIYVRGTRPDADFLWLNYVGPRQFGGRRLQPLAVFEDGTLLIMGALPLKELFRYLCHGISGSEGAHPPPDLKRVVRLVDIEPFVENNEAKARLKGRGLVSRLTWHPSAADMAELVAHIMRTMDQTERTMPSMDGLTGRCARFGRAGRAVPRRSCCWFYRSMPDALRMSEAT